ncbi:MAG: LysM peptidoglycan-binding domain-containing protein [Oscillospiraceae bacterium]|nr:LysM peptidoglycan-binding domain-containing protein [Oscillospiraceae bacterium]
MDDLRSADLAACAEKYIKSLGLSDKTIADLKLNLSSDCQRTTYTVVAGDCLWNLAYRFYGSGRFFGKIADANGIDSPYTIYIGQTLFIPD